MPFSRYIYELLLDHEVVIIPDFGAFITWIIPARIDEGNDTLLPPSKVVRFDPKIRNNDWLLVNFITGNEGISEHDALRKIRKFCDEILYRLDNGEHVAIEKTGTLYFDNNKELCFEQDKEASLLLNSYGLEPVPILPVEDYQEKTKEFKISSSEVENRNNFWWFLIFIPVIIGAYFIIRKVNKPEVQELKKIETIQDSIYSKQDTLSGLSDNLAKQDSLNPEKPTQSVAEVLQTKADTIQGKKYFVIGGSFAGEENAHKYISLMGKKGYRPFIIERKGRLTIVAIDVFSNMSQAVGLQKQMLNLNPKSGIWILVE